MIRINHIVVLTLMASMAIITTASGQQSAGGIQKLAGPDLGWTTIGTDFDAVRGGPQPVGDDPTHPRVGNFERGPGRQPTFRMANLDNPNLTDFAKESLK